MDEQDTCRICSAPAEPGAPLFHPCKCSGTIRYIHQDCLTTWLAHSKKKTCDVCKYQYNFTKVYSPNMPKQIPFILFLRKFAQQLFWAIVFALRGLLVATIWLVFLPYVTVWTWRFYFIMGENIAWWVSSQPRPSPAPVFSSYYSNISVVEDPVKTNASNGTIAKLATNYPVWRALSSDIFTGQIIASLIVLAFLGIFLLREWIMQNARPGVFEEDELNDNAENHNRLVEDANEPVPIPVEEPIVAEPIIPEHGNLEWTGIDSSLASTADAESSDLRSQNILQDVSQGVQSVPQDVPHNIPSDTPQGLSDLHFRSEVPSARNSVPSESLNAAEEPEVLLDTDLYEPPRLRRRTFKSRDTLKRQSYEAQSTQAQSWSNSIDRSSSFTRSKGKGKSRRSLTFNQPKEKNIGQDLSSPQLEDVEGFEFTFAIDRSSPPSASQLQSHASASFSFSAPHSSVPYHERVDYPPTRTPFVTDNDVSESSIPDANLFRPSLHGDPMSAHMDSLLNNSGISGIPDSPARLSDSLPSSGRSSPDIQQDHLSDSKDDQEKAGPVAGPSYRPLSYRYGGIKSDSDSSVGATVANSSIKDDLDDYFRDYSGESDVEGDWDDPHDERDGDRIRPEGLAGNAQNVPPENPQPQLEGDQVPDPPPDDADVINDDDVDGALEEAIGMRGSLTTVFQNAALMIFVLDATIGLGIWLPFTMGKTLALLSLEPLRILQIIHWPIRIIRYITDPFVDTCLFILRQFTHPFVKFCSTAAQKILSQFIPAASDNSTNITPALSLNITVLSNPRQEWLFKILGTSNSSESTVIPSLDDVARSPVILFLEPYFAWLGKRVRLNTATAKLIWADLSSGDTSFNRFFAIILGYAVIGFLVALYLNVLNVGNVQSAGRAIRNAIRQQLIVLKVATFILIELVIFPLGCGLMLDMCTLRLFPGASLQTRSSFFAYAPVTATFYHWMIGTMFMYQFAILLSGCRKLMRPGAMWFIKDPQDQNFHPIRDVLDRSTLTQLRKLAVSAVMYSLVVALGVGGIIFCFRLWGKTLLPFRWKLREPLSDVPIDLLFLHIVIPATIRYFRPRRIARSLANKFWTWMSRQLRLSSYMFGGQYPDEMQPSLTFTKWLSSFRSHLSEEWSEVPEAQSSSNTFDGSFRRVPAQDNIALPREIRATVAVDKYGNPVDENAQRLMEIQNAEAEKAKHQIADDYTVVYIPPHFGVRIIIFMVALWLVGSMVLVTSLALPIHLGRVVFTVLFNREVHDGYSLVVGFYMLWTCFLIGKTLDRADKRRQRSDGDEPRGEWIVYVFKRSILWIGQLLWMLFWMGFVIPTLVALVMEVYIVHPLRLIVQPDLVLNIHVINSWAIGLLYTRMAISTVRFRPETRVDLAINRLKEDGWKNPDAIGVTFNIILPVTGGLIAMLLLPVGLLLCLQRLLPTVINPKSLFIYVYPGIFVAAAATRVYASLKLLANSWAQQIRDSEFLVEMRLRNLENSTVPDASAANSTSSES